VSARPWRAAAYVPLGSSRYYTGSASAKTRAGLDRFVESRRSEGLVVDVWEVQPIREVAQLTQVASSGPG
jgi:hypothetical protein